MSGRIVWRGRQVSAQVRRAAAEGLFDAAEFLLEEANRTVPFAEGTLARSGTPSVDAGSLTAAVSYDTPYARRQHEHPEYRFQGGRRGKWLEKTLAEVGDQARQYVADRIRGALG